MGRKITIGEARASGADGLTVYCAGVPATVGGCAHSGKMTVMLALTLWGPETRLDELPLRCSMCGSRKVDVRPDFPYRAQGPWKPYV